MTWVDRIKAVIRGEIPNGWAGIPNAWPMCEIYRPKHGRLLAVRIGFLSVAAGSLNWPRPFGVSRIYNMAYDCQDVMMNLRVLRITLHHRPVKGIAPSEDTTDFRQWADQRNLARAAMMPGNGNWRRQP